MTDYKLVPVERKARALFEEMALIADDEKCIQILAKALAVAPAVQGEPAIRKLGIMGAAFDPPSVRRAYTYSDQPNNTTAWKLGRAAYKERSGGDLIDYGLQMLRYLQDEGFGVFEIDEAAPAPQPAQQQTDVAHLRAAIRRLCNIYVVDDYYDGQMREERLDEAVNRAINAVMETPDAP